MQFITKTGLPPPSLSVAEAAKSRLGTLGKLCQAEVLKVLGGTSAAKKCDVAARARIAKAQRARWATVRAVKAVKKNA